jgi:hypothetical protein
MDGGRRAYKEKKGAEKGPMTISYKYQEIECPRPPNK